MQATIDDSDPSTMNLTLTIYSNHPEKRKFEIKIKTESGIRSRIGLEN